MITPRFLSRALEFRETINRRAILADGAMGTMLYSRGLFINRCFDEVNLVMPDIVSEVHRDYLRAGAEMIETNTFGANRVRLSQFGIGDKLEEINRAGVRLAREAARDQAFIGASVGPLGIRIEPLGPTSYQEARGYFREQIQVLIDEGVDLLVLETFYQLNELREAISAAREIAGPDLVIIAQVTVDDDGRLMGGTDTVTLTQHLDQWDVDVIGLNCSSGPKVMLETLEQMVLHTAKPLSAMPNAGLPVQVEGRNIYLATPEYMSQYGRRFLQAGVKVIGGCCGTTPEHIKNLRAELRSIQPSRPKSPTVALDEGRVQPTAMLPVATGSRSELGAKLSRAQFVSFVEILPPRGVDAKKEIGGAALCRSHRIDVINVPDGPRASARMSAQATCQLIQREAGIETVLHFCCRDRNILGIQSELLGAYALGIRNLICITGDPPRMGTYPDATAVFDVDSIGLVNIVNNLNRGLDIGGNPIGSQTGFLIGVGANPGALNLDEELRRFDWKVQAGADYVVTQPVFDLTLLENFIRKTEHHKIPLVAGIWPLASYRNAEFMVNELRVPVPEHFMERMRRADTAERARAEGVCIAQEMVNKVQPMVQGIQLSVPFNRYPLVIEVAAAIQRPAAHLCQE